MESNSADGCDRVADANEMAVELTILAVTGGIFLNQEIVQAFEPNVSIYGIVAW